MWKYSYINARTANKNDLSVKLYFDLIRKQNKKKSEDDNADLFFQMRSIAISLYTRETAGDLGVESLHKFTELSTGASSPVCLAEKSKAPVLYE